MEHRSGLDAVRGGVQGALIGVPIGITIFFLFAPFQTDTWPGELDSSVGYGSSFGIATGSIAGALLGGSSRMGSRIARQVVRCVVGIVAPVFGLVTVAHLAELSASHRLPDPRAVLERVVAYGRPSGDATAAIACSILALAAALLVAGSRWERRRSVDARSVALVVVVEFVLVSFAAVVNGHGPGVDVLAGFATAIGFVAVPSLRVAQRIGQRFDP